MSKREPKPDQAGVLPGRESQPTLVDEVGVQELERRQALAARTDVASTIVDAWVRPRPTPSPDVPDLTHNDTIEEVPTGVMGQAGLFGDRDRPAAPEVDRLADTVDDPPAEPVSQQTVVTEPRSEPTGVSGSVHQDPSIESATLMSARFGNECRMCGGRIGEPTPRRFRSKPEARIGYCCDRCGNIFCSNHVVRSSGLLRALFSSQSRFRCVLCASDDKKK